MDSVDYELEYVHEEVNSGYSRDSLDRAYRSLIANGVSTVDCSRVGSLGDLKA